MIATTVALHDIRDTESFVAATIQRSRILMSQQEFEELKCEGLVILCELADRFEPHRPGYATPGRFSGFAARYLPGKLQDRWRKLHPEHQQTTTLDGRREWEYGHKPMSLGSLGEDGSISTGSAPVFMIATSGVPGGLDMPLITHALDLLPNAYRPAAEQYLTMTSEGYGVDAIARSLGVRRGDVQQVRSGLASAISMAREAA